MARAVVFMAVMVTDTIIMHVLDTMMGIIHMRTNVYAYMHMHVYTVYIYTYMYAFVCVCMCMPIFIIVYICTFLHHCFYYRYHTCMQI